MVLIGVDILHLTSQHGYVKIKSVEHATIVN